MNALLTRGRRAAAIVAGAVVATSLAVVPAATAQAQPESCLVVDYQVTTWSNTPDSGGFVVNVTLTNVCDEPVNGWTLELTLPPGQQLTGVWSANVAIAGNEHTFTPAGWNAVIVPGGSATFGFIGTWTGTYQDPLSCTINGAPCDGGSNQPPEVTLTSPAGVLVAYNCPVLFAADASDPDGSVDRVEFYVNGALVATAEEAPFEVESSGGGFSGQNTLFARAFDDGSPVLSTDSDPVTVLLVPPPPTAEIISCTRTLEIEEGTSELIEFQLSSGHTASVDLTVTGAAGIAVSPSSFTLESGMEEVTVTAAAGSAGATATISASAPEAASFQVQVTVVDG